jgi:hypothetical protein
MRFLCVPFVIILFVSAYGQTSLDIPEASPPGTVRQKVGFTTITIYYERPAARGRSESEIFGRLVPFGKVWRTGAGNCTTIKFNTDVFIDGKKVVAGKYALFTIPDREKWTVVLNTDTLAYGAYGYDQNKDVLRTVVDAKDSDRFYESLTIDVDFVPNDARIYISWLNTQISFGVNTGLDAKILSFIRENLILRDSDNPALYESAIVYYLWHRQDRTQLMKFINKGISLNNDRVWYYWKVEELMKDGKYDEALTAAQGGIDSINQSGETNERKIELIYDFEAYKTQITNRKNKVSK